MYSMPSRISVSRRCRGRSIGARSSRRTNARPMADSANEAASMASVAPGPDGRREEAGDGRSDDVAERVDGLEVRVRAGHQWHVRPARGSTRCSPPGRTNGARSSAPPRSGSRRSSARGGRPTRGSGRSAPARPRSARNIIRLRSLRSASAPATIPNTRSGSVWSAPTTPIASPEPVSARTSSGSAVKLTASPSDEMPWRREEHLEVAVARERFEVRVPVGHRFDGSGAVSWSAAGEAEWRNSP